MFKDNTKQEYAAPEVEIIHFESNQALLQSSGGGGHVFPQHGDQSL